MRSAHTSTSIGFVTLTVSAALLLLAVAAEGGPIPAVNSFNGNGFGQFPGLNTSLGFEFHTNQQITVRELGVLDGNADGLATAHPIGIFSNAGALLASSTIPAGTAGTLDGPFDPAGLLVGSGFRYVALDAPLVLAANTNFVIGAYYGIGSADEEAFSPAFATDPAVSFVRTRFRFSTTSSPFSTLVFPTSFDTSRDLSLNFRIDPPVPEPSTLVLLGVGFAGILAMRRRTRGGASIVGVFQVGTGQSRRPGRGRKNVEKFTGR